MSKQRENQRPFGQKPSAAASASRQAVDPLTQHLRHMQQQAGNWAVVDWLQTESRQPPETAVEQGRSNAGQPLPTPLQEKMEAGFGTDFSDVRLHADPQAVHANQQLEADAYTVGSDVVWSGRHPLNSPAGEGLLAHELAHVVQQRQPIVSQPLPTRTPALEQQANSAAAAVSAGQSAAVQPVGAAGAQFKKAEEKTEEKKEEKKDSPGFFDRVWSGIKSAGSAIWGGLKKAGSFVWEGLKTAGSAIWEGMKKLGGWIKIGAEAIWTAIKWVGKQLWDKITGIFGRLTFWLSRLPKRIGRLFAGLWEGLVSLKPWSLDWWKSLGKADTWGNFLKWLGTRVIDLVNILPVGEAYETLMDFVKFNTRTLNESEIKLASSIFGSSIRYDLVRVDEGAILGPAFSKRAYVSFHTINDWGAIKPDTFLHEMTHVWQYQNDGAIYMPQAIHAQVWGEGYDYGGLTRLRNEKAAGKGMSAFNREQQGQIVLDFYRLREGQTTTKAPGATAADLPLFAHFIKDVSTLSETQLVTK